MRRSFFLKGKEQGCLGGGSPFKDTTSTTTKEGSATHPGEVGGHIDSHGDLNAGHLKFCKPSKKHLCFGVHFDSPKV